MELKMPLRGGVGRSRMINFKKAVALVASATMLVGVAACGNNASSSASSNSTQNIKLTVWTPSEDISSGWTAKEESKFAKAHKNYKIKWTNKPVAESDASKTVKTDPSAAADVYMFANDQLGTLVSANAIGQLSTSAAAQVKEDNDASMIQSVTASDGNMYGVPYNGNTWFMFYNKSKISAADAKSFDTMLSKAKVSFPLDNSWYLPAFFVANGAQIFGAKGDDAKAGVDFGGKAGLDVTKYLINVVNNKNFVLDSNGSGLAGLKTGAVDVLFSGSWDAANVKKALGNNYAAAQLPTANIGGQAKQLKSFSGSKAVAYNPNSKYPKVASQFAAFLGSKGAQLDHYEMRDVIPSSKSLLADPKLKADPCAQAQANTIANTSILQPTIAAMNNFWTPVQTFGKSLAAKGVNAGNAENQLNSFAKGLSSAVKK
jgi:arabinogalactan oligomer/maltooligosaccharide transport system substrate-binding protein